MDVISFSEAATANSRIEIINANPDSTSGIVTVPKVIASGETVTIPAGRVAILPNVQIDGVLNVDGEVFIPSGATLGDLDAQLALKAPLVNPAFTNPTATTQTAGDNSTKLATTAYVDGKMVLGTAVASTSGTAIDFTGIPSWVKRITVMFDRVSTNGSSNIQIQIGDTGGIENTGYFSTASSVSSAVQSSGSTTGYIISGNNDSGNSHTGVFNLCLNSLNKWNATGIHTQTTIQTAYCAGSKTLSGTLNRIRITTVNGTDTFDAGSINILYEG